MFIDIFGNTLYGRGLVDESKDFMLCEIRMRTPRSFDMVKYVRAP